MQDFFYQQYVSQNLSEFIKSWIFIFCHETLWTLPCCCKPLGVMTHFPKCQSCQHHDVISPRSNLVRGDPWNGLLAPPCPAVEWSLSQHYRRISMPTLANPVNKVFMLLGASWLLRVDYHQYRSVVNYFCRSEHPWNMQAIWRHSPVSRNGLSPLFYRPNTGSPNMVFGILTPLLENKHWPPNLCPLTLTTWSRDILNGTDICIA